MPPPSPQPILPVLERRDDIAALIQSHQILILCGQTGSGKTTQLPQICLDLGLARTAQIAHTQPRRLAARAVAARIAEERDSPLGQLVGVKVRFHEQTSRATRIKVMTDGMLLAELASDPSLRNYAVIIIDEAHERSLNIDFLLGYLRTLLPKRPDLKLIVTSATIDPKRFSDYFGGPAIAPVIEVSGRMFPVEVRYAPPPGQDDEPDRVSTEAVADAVEDLTSTSASGDVLVFLPGEREIRLAADAISRRRLNLEVLPLFSRLSNAEQDRIFHPAPNRQRVILATNIAETSLTVPGIRYVVDTGLARQARYDPARKIQRLPIEPVSRAAADQRAGRCGRVQSGICVRLYSQTSFNARPAFTDPEIRRTSLASVILSMLALDLGPIDAFPFIEPPPAAAIDDGYHTLFELGAIDAPSRTAALTPIGRDLSRIPLDPRVARMLLAAQSEGAVNDVITLAAALSIQDPRERPAARQEAADSAHQVFRDPTSDFLSLLNIADQYRHAESTLSTGPLFNWCRDHFLAPARMREWSDMSRQLRDIARDLDISIAPPGAPRADPDRIHRALLAGLISNVACREAEQGSFDFRSVRGGVVHIFPGSALFKKSPKWIMAAEIVETSRLYARTVAKIDPEWLEELAAHMFKRQLTDPHLDAETGVPSAFERVSMSGIVVVPRRPADLAKADPAAARRIFIAEALAKARWKSDLPLIAHTRATLAHARDAEHRLRKRNLARTDDELAAWFDARLPSHIRGPDDLTRWLAADPANEPRLRLSPADVLKPEAAEAFDQSRYPDTIALPGATKPLAIAYALAPGKDDDGLTLSLPLLSLPALTPDRAAWLVPGLVPELILVLLKQLPKDRRAQLESKSPLPDLSQSLADLLDFAAAPLPTALAEAIHVLYALDLPPALFTAALKGLPDHLKLRVRVLDELDRPIAESHDLPALITKLEPRLAKARSARAKVAFAQTNLTAWTFDDLPDRTTPDSPDSPAFPALVDDRDSVSLTLAASPEHAAALTHHGVRRLFALACAEDLGYHLEALPNLHDLVRLYQPFGTAAELKADLAALMAERAFTLGQPPVRTRADFEQRLADQRHRLAAVSRDVADLITRILEPRAKVAHRLASGTPRLWAASIADIREHATYLLPRGFLLNVPDPRLRRYPIYAESMRERLFSLREEGSKVEQSALAAFSPHWKRYTGYIAQAMSRQRQSLEAAGEPAAPAATPSSAKAKAPLPQTRRAGALVNLDAGQWAAHAAATALLPPALDAYRWALEDLRVALFAPQLAGAKPSTTVADIERLWKSVPDPAR